MHAGVGDGVTTGGAVVLIEGAMPLPLPLPPPLALDPGPFPSPRPIVVTDAITPRPCTPSTTETPLARTRSAGRTDRAMMDVAVLYALHGKQR